MNTEHPNRIPSIADDPNQIGDAFDQRQVKIAELEARAAQAGDIADRAIAEQGRLRGILDEALAALAETDGGPASPGGLAARVRGVISAERAWKRQSEAMLKTLNDVSRAAGVEKDVPLNALVACVDGKLAALRSNAEQAKQTLKDVAHAAGLATWTDGVSTRASLVEHVGILRRNSEAMLGRAIMSEPAPYLPDYLLPKGGSKPAGLDVSIALEAQVKHARDAARAGVAGMAPPNMAAIGDGPEDYNLPPRKAPTITVDEQMFRGLVRAAKLLEAWQDGKIWDNTAAAALEMARKVGFAAPAPRPSPSVELARAGMFPNSRGRVRDTIEALNDLLDRVRVAAGGSELPIIALPAHVEAMARRLEQARASSHAQLADALAEVSTIRKEDGSVDHELTASCRTDYARDSNGDPSIKDRCGDNARRWAEEFTKLHGGDVGLMIAWFANAIETACDVRERRRPVDHTGCELVNHEIADKANTAIATLGDIARAAGMMTWHDGKHARGALVDLVRQLRGLRSLEDVRAAASQAEHGVGLVSSAAIAEEVRAALARHGYTVKPDSLAELVGDLALKTRAWIDEPKSNDRAEPDIDDASDEIGDKEQSVPSRDADRPSYMRLYDANLLAATGRNEEAVKEVKAWLLDSGNLRKVTETADAAASSAEQPVTPESVALQLLELASLKVKLRDVQGAHDCIHSWGMLRSQ